MLSLILIHFFLLQSTTTTTPYTIGIPRFAINGSTINYTLVVAAAQNFTGNVGSLYFRTILDIPSAIYGSIVGLTALNPSLNPSFFIGLVDSYGYAALFSITLLDSASISVAPSEVVLPVAGLLAKTGHMYIFTIVFVLFLGQFLGTAIDYTLAYTIGRDGVYRYLHLLKIKRKDLRAFDRWFNEHGAFAVFASRLLPVVRSIMNFPAGFSKMSPLKFFTYSMAGILIWDVILLLFGYFLISSSNSTIIEAAIGVGAITLYVMTKITLKDVGLQR